MSQDFNIEVVSSKSSLPILKVNNFYLHSKYDPKKEAEQFANSQFTENHVHILFGYGYGYFANALKKKCKENEHLLIIDPIYKKSKDIVEQKDFEIIRDVNEKTIENALNNLLKDYNTNVKIICSPNYDRILPKEYKIVLKTVKEILSVNRIFFNTVNYFAEIWQENYIRNIFHIFEDESLSVLEDCYNLPVVIAAGGPSLTKQIPLLKEMQNNVLIIAAGSTVNTLLHYNIEADFIVSVDGSIVNYKHFENNTFENSHLIYSTKNHYDIRKQFKKTAFSFIPAFEPGVYDHVKQITQKQLPTLLGGSSVANYALVIAQYISSGPIALIGQDLAYTDNQTHAKYNKHFANINDDYKENRGTFYTDGYNGDEVLTDVAFLSMKKGFEQIAEVSSKRERLYNCTEGGAKIKGYTQIPFRDFYGLIDLSGEKDIHPIFLENTLNESDWEKLCCRIQAEIDIYLEIERLITNGLKYLDDCLVNEKFTRKILNELEKIDKKIKRLFKKVSMNSILEPIIIDTMNNYLPINGETEQQNFKRVHKQNSSLYNGFLNATKLSKVYTTDLLEKVKKEKLGGM
ncbi:6-hydroxymethylpterin diphosphokinase MptE-like protein [Viridibacillus arvi]|uniref:motility associated factor glycosyltransferase family protein n=1 Tax=Viridibacillus arvi TaxID=263475 RepID=UPI003D2C0228